jgi:hypothetical protein
MKSRGASAAPVLRRPKLVVAMHLWERRARRHSPSGGEARSS